MHGHTLAGHASPYDYIVLRESIHGLQVALGYCEQRHSMSVSGDATLDH